MKNSLQKQIRAYLNENPNPALEALAIFDHGRPGEIVRLSQANLHAHTDSITGVIRAILGSHAPAYLERCLSLSSHDALNKGFKTLRTSRTGMNPNLRIEAHAYSLREFARSQSLHKEIHNLQNSPLSNNFIVTSSGHEPGLSRFPGTVESTFSVGTIGRDGTLLGKAAVSSAKPDLFVDLQAFDSILSDGRAGETLGSSPAVVLIALLAAILAPRLNSAKHFSESMKGLLLLLSDAHEGVRVLRSIHNLAQLSFAADEQWSNTLQTSLTLKVRANAGTDAKIAVVPLVGEGGHLWRQSPLQFSVNGKADGGKAFNRVLDASEIGDGNVCIQFSGIHRGYSLSALGCEIVDIQVQRTEAAAPGDRIVVGVSASHDASACLIKNGKLIKAVQLERVSGIKHDGEPVLNSDSAIEYCLNSAGLKKEDVRLFAYNIQAATPEYTGLAQPVRSGAFKSFDPFDPNTLFVSHHLSHAFSAYAGAKSERAKVIVCDGSGGTAVGAGDLLMPGSDFKPYLERGLGGERPLLHTFSVYQFNKRSFELIAREESPSFNVRSGSKSIGEAYAAVSQFVFGSWQSSGKLMGLAPYGEVSEEMLDQLLADPSDVGSGFGHAWKNQYFEASKDPFKFKDLAAVVQRILENALLMRFRRHVNREDNVAFSGGVALNSVANRKIREQVRPQSFFQLPASSDAGISIGCAAAAEFHITGEIPSEMFQHDFLGHTYSQEDLASAINRYAPYLNVTEVSPDDLAQRLSQGQIFGHYSLTKGSEFGPRALGARSILADPRKRATWDHINRWVKYREEFRPFAPMVAREKLSQFFEADEDLPYMLEVVRVKEPHRPQLAAVTHVDGSARVQTVANDQNAEIHGLLLAFEKYSGYPILLNTSFNVRGQPIVETPQQAIEMLLSTQLDGVIFGKYLVEVHGAKGKMPSEGLVSLAPGCEILDRIHEGRRSTAIHAKHQGKTFAISQNLLKWLSSNNGGPVQISALPVPAGEEAQILRKQVTRLILLKVLNQGRDEA